MRYITIYEYDDTDSFGHHLAKVNLNNHEQATITKAKFLIGKLEIVINNPVFPFYVDLSAEDYVKLKTTNHCYLILFDEENKRKTVDLKTIIEIKKRGE